MKRKMLLIFCMLIFVVCSVIGFTACGGSDGDDGVKATEGLKYTLSDDGKSYICNGFGELTEETAVIVSTFDIDIASEYNGKPVTAIGESAFEYCETRSVTIPDSVTSIGNKAFHFCFAANVIIPASVVTVGEMAFGGCNAVIYCEAAAKPDGWSERWRANEYGGYDARAVVWDSKNNSVIEDGTISYPIINNIRYIIGVINYGEDTAIADMALNVKGNVKIPSSVTYKGKTYRVAEVGGFYDCSKLTGITIPDSVTYISAGAFSGCSSLKSVTIPNSVTYIGAGAFFRCGSLTNITIPDSVTYIGVRIFFECSSLTSISIPDGIDSIGGDAFQGCSSLTNITIPDSVTSIDSRAFYNCSSLTDINVPDCLKSVSIDAFDGTGISFTEDNNAYYFGNSNNPYLIFVGVKDRDSETYVINGKTKSISYNAFNYCKNLKSIVIPDGVTTIGNSAFSDCSSLESITIPDSVTYIGSSAFRGCYGLKSITIPDSVTAIDERAFEGCNSLTIYCEAESKPDGWNNYWNDNVNDNRDNGRVVVWNCKNNEVAQDGYIYAVIDGIRYALKDRNATVAIQSGNLTSVNIPAEVTYKENVYTVTTIGEGAFEECSGLESIIIPDSVTYIGSGAFRYCKNLIIYCEAESKPEGWEYDWNDNRPTVWNYKNNDVANDGYIHTAIDGIKYTLRNGEATVTEQSDNLTVVNIPVKVTYKNIDYSVTAISNNAFYGCSGLERITIPDSVTTIGRNAFYYSSLTSITIPDSVTFIGEGAFEGCNKLIQTEDGVRYVGKWVVGCDNSVAQVILKSGTKGIVGSAFSWCSKLENLTIPDSVIFIGERAFYNCTSLKSVTIPAFAISYLPTDNLETVTITDGDTIPNSAFRDCIALTSITISGVTRIESYAFEGCRGLESITISDSVTYIGNNAFHYCGNLTSVTIGSGVTSISSAAFSYCDKLTSIYYTGDIASWCKINGLGYLTQYGSRSKTLYIDGKEITGELIIPDGVTSIGYGAFENIGGPISITIPDSVTSIGNYAFYNCSYLTDITFNGTKEQWEAINKGSKWDYYTGDYTIHCTDGDIAKS